MGSFPEFGCGGLFARDIACTSVMIGSVFAQSIGFLSSFLRLREPVLVRGQRRRELARR